MTLDLRHSNWTSERRECWEHLELKIWTVGRLCSVASIRNNMAESNDGSIIYRLRKRGHRVAKESEARAHRQERKQISAGRRKLSTYPFRLILFCNYTPSLLVLLPHLLCPRRFANTTFLATASFWDW